MKRGTKIGLITAASLMLAGILGFFGVMTVNHWDINALESGGYETNTVTLDNEFNHIAINSDISNVVFFKSGNEKCTVEFFGRGQMKSSAVEQNGTLSIEYADTGKWYDNINFFSEGSPQIAVYLPGNEYESLTVVNGTGMVIIPQDFSFENISIFSDTGDVDCEASFGGLIHIETGTGEIYLENVSAGEIELSAYTGDMDICMVKCEGDVTVTADTGHTALADISCKNLFSCGDTGSIYMEKLIAKELISVERDAGDVSLEQCDASELQIQTFTGDITGSLLSDKVFIVQSDLGDVDVPETTGGGRCKLTSETGDITMEIK